MSRIDVALRRAAGQADNETPAQPSEFSSLTVAELTFEEKDAPDFEPVPPVVEASPVRGEPAAPAKPDVPATAPPRVVAPPAVQPAEPRHVTPPVHAPMPSGGNGHGAALSQGGDLPGAVFHGFAADVVKKLVVGEYAGRTSANSVATEQFRRLAASLHHAQVEREIRAVLITSALAGEGKTLTASNLALTLSESYRRNVLLIDADLRRPGLHQVFQVPNTTGLHEGLAEQGDGKLPLLEITPRLMVLPAGRPDSDPMSALASSRMRRIIEEGCSRFDWVIVDAPPVGLITDASLLAKMVDATLMVVRAGKTDYPIVRRAIDAIGRERIFGVVLNRLTLPESPYGYRYGRYYASYRTHPDGGGSR